MIYWRELETVLSLGGGWFHNFSDLDDDPQRADYFCAPYTFYADYSDELDPYSVVMVIGADTPLRAGPDEAYQIVGRLDYAIAEMTENPTGFDPDNPGAPYWVGVRTADGALAGFLPSTAFRSPIDYSACFSFDRQTGAATWDAFIAGD